MHTKTFADFLTKHCRVQVESEKPIRAEAELGGGIVLRMNSRTNDQAMSANISCVLVVVSSLESSLKNKPSI